MSGDGTNDFNYLSDSKNLPQKESHLTVDKNEENEIFPLEIQTFEIDPQEVNHPKHKHSRRKIFSHIIMHAIVVGYFSYVTYNYMKIRETCTKDCNLHLCSPYGMLLFVLGCTYGGILYFKIIKRFFKNFFINEILRRIKIGLKIIFKPVISRLMFPTLLVITFFVYIFYETRQDFTRLRALVAIALCSGIGFLISANPRKIIWRPVICGFVLQFLLGIIFIRWPVGRNIFECFGQKAAQFLNYGASGAAFVYGDFLISEKSVFAFAVMTIIFYVGLCVSVLYYLGAMQWILLKFGWILQSILGTTICESVVAVGSIFLSISETSLVIRPFIKSLTDSELHAVLTSGMATVSGSVLVAYISFGAQPQHLITASVMAAPASLFFAKLVYPEVEKSKTSADNIQLEKSSNTSILDAATSGASQAISLVLNIIANLIAFVSFIALADGIVKWIFHLAGFNDTGIEFFLGKLFMPVSWIIGVEWEDCEEVGNVIGTKTIINEFVGFQRMGKYLENGEISKRSAAIATYAICSFANPASIGTIVGIFSVLAPDRKSSVTQVAFRSFVSACLVTLVTASIASLLMPEDLY